MGVMNTCRFSYYPGHPLYHLYYVSKFEVLSLLRLARQDQAETSQLFVEYSRALGIVALFGPYNICTSNIMTILSFLPAGHFKYRSASFASSSFTFSHTIAAETEAVWYWTDRVAILSVLEHLIHLLLGGKRMIAQKILCLHAKNRTKIRQTDRLGLAT
jgi:hypothetical protein